MSHIPQDPIRDFIRTQIATLKQYGRDAQLPNLWTLRDIVIREIDRHLDRVRDARDLVTRALQKQRDLQRYRVSVWRSWRFLTLRKLLSVPFIYGMIIPALILHVALEIYHQVCFRLYDIPRVRARDYFIFDRGHLSYLNWLEKINCAYCSYFNGLTGYATEIAGRTERYWCPIKHARRRAFTHSQYPLFVEYLDGKHYQQRLMQLRRWDSNRDAQ